HPLCDYLPSPFTACLVNYEGAPVFPLRRVHSCPSPCKPLTKTACSSPLSRSHCKSTRKSWCPCKRHPTSKTASTLRREAMAFCSGPGAPKPLNTSSQSLRTIPWRGHDL